VTVRLTGSALTLGELVRVARAGEAVELTAQALDRMRATRDVLERALDRGETVYGLTTGVGAKKSIAVDANRIDEHNRLLVLNHRVGQGPSLPPDVARGAVLRLANHLASGAPGSRPQLAQALVDALNAGVVPQIRSLGSIGISDLSSNADLAHGSLHGFALIAGEGIAVLNHNAVSTAHAALALHDAGRLLDTLEVCGALDLEAFGANTALLDPAIADVRPYPGLVRSLARLREALAGSYLWQPAAARNLQDPLCFRCLPQLLGAARDPHRYALDQLSVELNAHQGNPLVISGPAERIVSVGNFDIAPLAAALDFVRIALAPLITSLGERAVKLLQRPLSGLPEGLAVEVGSADDGLAEFGIAVQSIVSEARLLAQPVSFELAGTTQAEGIEDRATSAPLAARRLAQQVDLASRAAAIALVVAAQAVDLRGSAPLGAETGELHRRVRRLAPALAPGEPIPQDLEPVVDLVRAGLA